MAKRKKNYRQISRFIMLEVVWKRRGLYTNYEGNKRVRRFEGINYFKTVAARHTAAKALIKSSSLNTSER